MRARRPRIPGVAIAGVYAPTRAHAERLSRAVRRHGLRHARPPLDHRPLDLVVDRQSVGPARRARHRGGARGIHVLVEKPIDVSTAQADALIDAAARAGVTLGVIFQDRLKPGPQRMKTLVDAGRLGTPDSGDRAGEVVPAARYYAGSRWRGRSALDGGGALMNQGVHTVDLLLWLFGPVRRVFGRTATALHAIEVEDTAVAVVEFANGALGTIEATTSAYPGYSRRTRADRI